MGKVQKIAFAAMAFPLLLGCMPDSPRTALDWGVNDTLHRPAASREATKTYQDKSTYQDKDVRPAPRSTATVSRNTLAPVTASSQPLPPVGGAPAFAWPVSGRVISDFGSTANGGKNDGINIATTMDAPIRASASGTVTYAGDALKNYGNLVLVKHSGGYTTAYAHADRLLVARGAFVTQGQVIGYAGQTGDVSSPQLHFEIRSATTPVNPRSYLSSNTASN
ncbi:MAG TPA: M23 family metallopeptidase [Rhizomicrobium sp.]|nr:M23 family metallopeptidase [Rhizomicrobium sp.]